MTLRYVGKSWLRLFLLLNIKGALLSACTSLKTPEINGGVVDAETGKPIDGARIYVKWQRIIASPGGQTGGSIDKELRLQVKEDDRFTIPAYALRNYIPYPFGQGGTFYMIVYAHEYMYKKFIIYSTTSFDYEEILKDYAKPNGLILKLTLITNPDDWRENIGRIPEHELIEKGDDWIEIKNEYVTDEYKLFVDKFGMKRWDRFNQAQLVKAYIRFGDYKSAVRKIEEIIENYPDAKKNYLTELEEYKNKLREPEKKR